MTKYSVDEVLSFRDITFAPSDPGYAMATDHAERIKADEGAGVPFCPECGTCRENPPAQAAQSEAVFTGLHIDGTPRYERVAQPRALPGGMGEAIRSLVTRWREPVAGYREEDSYMVGYDHACKHLATELEAALATPPAQPAERVVEGMVLVPMEPTCEMRIAGGTARGKANRHGYSVAQKLDAIYAAMLTAAQQADR